MSGSRATVWRCLAVGVGLAVLAPPVLAQSSIVLPRPGQVGLGMQGQFGSLLRTGDIGETFDVGPGLAVRLRYRMRFERGLGVSFESQTFEARRQFTDSLFAPVEVKIVTAGPEVYQMFGTRTRTTKMLSVGVGIAQVSYELADGEKTFPGDGVYVSAGAGIERFFWRNWAFDFSTRYLAIFQRGQANHDVQGSAGLIFYASY